MGHRFCGFDRKHHDIRFAQFAQDRLHDTLVQAFGQTGHRLPANLVVNIRQPDGKGIADGGRVHLGQGAERERRPISSVAVLIGRKCDQRVNGGLIVTAAKSVRKGTTNVLRRMAYQSR